MLKDLARRLFFRRSTTYFLITFLCACAQIILRTALFVTDNAEAQYTGAKTSYNLNATQSLYSITSTGGFENRTDFPGEMDVYSLGYIRAMNDKQQFCTMFAAYTSNLFRDNRMEDSVFIAIHIYLVLVSLYAIAKESIPHLIFIFSARLLSTAWALGRLIETVISQKTFNGLIQAGNCGSGPQFFGRSFYSNRHTFEGILLGVSVLSVISEAFVASKLGRIYSERPWRVVQVSSEMRKMYRLILGFSVIAQMTGLILPVTLALWVDQLLNTYFKVIVENHTYIYGTIFIFITILLPIWITLGWFALRREWKKVTSIYLGLGVVLLCCWFSVWASAMFRWAFTTWWFFGTLYCVSLVLLIAAFVLAIICRRNFGKNLDHYLMVQSRLSAMDFAHAHFEKDEELDSSHIPDVFCSDSEYDGKSIYERDSWGPMMEKTFEFDS